MGNICGAAPSKDHNDQPTDRKSEQKERVSKINAHLLTNNMK